jgi:3',5'-cyclic AMP phosphodiesterase CpdA
MYDVLSLYPRYIEIMGQAGIPWYHVPGNHDVNYHAPDDERSLETFKRYFGPGYYSFDFGQAHFIALDTVNYLGKRGSRQPAHDGTKSDYEGWVVDRQLTWLENDLALVPRDKLIVLAMHIPLDAYGDRGRTRGVVGNADAVLRLVEGRPHVMAVSGHLHSTQHHYLANGVHLHVITTACGSWWSGPKDERGIPVAYQEGGTPNGYHVMTVRGNEATLRYKAASDPADLQMRISVHWDQVVVNLFDGGPRSKVELRIDDAEAVAMKPTAINDPFIDDLYEKTKRTWKSWIDIDPSHHLWTATLPDSIGPGVHTIRVTAVDEYGHTHTSHLIFER